MKILNVFYEVMWKLNLIFKEVNISDLQINSCIYEKYFKYFYRYLWRILCNLILKETIIGYSSLN